MAVQDRQGTVAGAFQLLTTTVNGKRLGWERVNGGFAPTDLRLRLSAQQQWIVRLSLAKRVLSSFAVATLIFSCGGLIDWLVSHHYLPRIFFMVSGAVVSLIVGLLFLNTLSEVLERHQMLLQRVQDIAELNHDIRNALQVIAFNNVPERSAEAINQIDAAIGRIDSVLKERVSTSRSGRPAG